MSKLSDFVSGAGGASYTHMEEFLASGTFTPSAKLLSLGGNVCIIAVGGGGTGGSGSGGYSGAGGGGGGGGGILVNPFIIVSGATTVTIGAGGTGVALAGSTSFGTASRQTSALGGSTGGSHTGDVGGLGGAHGAPANAGTLSSPVEGSSGAVYGGWGGGSWGDSDHSNYMGAGVDSVANSGAGGMGSGRDGGASGNGGSGRLRVYWNE